MQSYEHYAYGHQDLRGPNYRRVDLDQRRMMPKSQLCQLNFLQGHECIFGPYCVFAHSITDVEERIFEVIIIGFNIYNRRK